jgi:hypothetical protein
MDIIRIGMVIALLTFVCSPDRPHCPIEGDEIDIISVV